MKFVNKYNSEKFLEVKFIIGKAYCVQTVNGYVVSYNFIRLKFLRQLLDGYIFIPLSSHK